MKSTDHNLNNPLRVGDIELLRTAESWQLPSIIRVSQEFYDLLQIKDPHAIYIITDTEDRRMYYGDILIRKEKNKVSYLIGPSNIYGQYVLYLNQVENYVDHLIEICKFNDVQEAINTMILYNNIGSHHLVNVKIYKIIVSFINDDISLNDLLIGLINIFGYGSDPRLQQLIETTITYDVKSSRKDLPIFFREELPKIAKVYSNCLYEFYSNLYDIIVEYDFFKDTKYNTSVQKLDLSDVVNDIIDVCIRSIN